MRWAMYEPPPGSAPGYHTDHHWIVSGMMNTVIAAPQLPKSGSMCRDEAGTFAKSPLMPPISGCLSAKYVTANAPVIVMPNWSVSVTSTPHRPDTDAKKIVMIEQTSSVCQVGQPSTMLPILAAARFTVAMMKQLKKSPR